MGKQWKTVADFIFWGSKITADGDCSHEIKRCLFLGRKVMTSLGSILKSRDITLSTKVRLVKAMVFPVVMYGCETWTMKKADLLQNGLVGSPCSPKDFQESSLTPQFKSISSVVAQLSSQSKSHIHT